VALSGVVFPIAVFAGVAPHLVLPAIWALRRAADAHRLELAEPLGRPLGGRPRQPLSRRGLSEECPAVPRRPQLDREPVRSLQWRKRTTPERHLYREPLPYGVSPPQRNRARVEGCGHCRLQQAERESGRSPPTAMSPLWPRQKSLVQADDASAPENRDDDDLTEQPEGAAPGELRLERGLVGERCSEGE
jgi:hypothetical protein